MGPAAFPTQLVGSWQVLELRRISADEQNTRAAIEIQPFFESDLGFEWHIKLATDAPRPCFRMVHTYSIECDWQQSLAMIAYLEPRHSGWWWSIQDQMRWRQ